MITKVHGQLLCNMYACLPLTLVHRLCQIDLCTYTSMNTELTANMTTNQPCLPHCLHHLLPPTNSASGRHSTRLIDVHNTRARTQLRKNTILMNFCNKQILVPTFSIKLIHVLFFFVFVISLKRGSHKFLKTFVFLPIGKYKDYIIILLGMLSCCLINTLVYICSSSAC